MKQVDIFKQKIFTGDKKQMLFFWKAIKNMNKYISVFLIFFLNACISPSGYLSSDNSTSYYFDATNGSDDNNGTSPDKAWKNLAKTRGLKLSPGDKILLKKGETFIGELYLNGTGTAEAPIIIDGYGDKGHDPCIIGYDQSPYAVYVYNSSQITIQNLEIVNTGKDRLPGRTGVKVHLENYGTARSITLRNLYIHDVNGSLVKKQGGGSGIYIVNEGEKPSIFDGLTIENCIIRRCERNGIIWWGYVTRDFWHPNRHVVVRNNLIEGVPGDGIVPIGCDSAVIEYNRIKNCPDLLPDGEFADGIWPWSCDNTLIQFNEVSDHKAPGDAQGFDSDNNCNNTIIQYNYSHDNEGGFLLICNTGETGMPENIGTNNTLIQGNISINDGNRTKKIGTGFFSPSIHISGPAKGSTLRHNIIHVTKKVNSDVQRCLLSATQSYGDADSTTVCENLFYVAENSCFLLGNSTNNFFKDNCYLGNIKNIPEDEGATYENKTYSNMIKNDLSGVESLKPFLHSVNTPTGELQIVDSDAINSFFSK